jgi:hypothetical protein
MASAVATGAICAEARDALFIVQARISKARWTATAAVHASLVPILDSVIAATALVKLSAVAAVAVRVIRALDALGDRVDLGTIGTVAEACRAGSSFRRVAFSAHTFEALPQAAFPRRRAAVRIRFACASDALSTAVNGRLLQAEDQVAAREHPYS